MTTEFKMGRVYKHTHDPRNGLHILTGYNAINSILITTYIHRIAEKNNCYMSKRGMEPVKGVISVENRLIYVEDYERH